MDNLRYGVSNKTRFEKLYVKQRFFPYSLLALLFILIIAVLFLLFPGRSLVQSLLNQNYFSLVDFRYSLLLLERNTKFPLKYSEIQKHPEQAIIQLNEVRKSFYQNKDWENLWLSYNVVKALVYDETKTLAVRKSALKLMIEFFHTFEKNSNSMVQLNVLAQDALEADAAPDALVFYEKIIKQNPDQSVYFYANAAKAALWAKQCNKSADLYFAAQHRAKKLNDQRYFYIKALRTLFSCEKYELALSLADKNINGLSQDPITYEILVDLALKASQPQKAEIYVRKLLDLRNQPKPTK